MALLLARPAHERSTGKGKEGAGDSGPSHGLGYEEGEEQTFGREGEGPNWSKPWARRQGLAHFFQIVFPNTFFK